MENNEKVIIVKDAKGKEKEGHILFTFEANGDNFVLYELDDNAFAAKVDEEGNLSPVEEDEWKLIEKIYKEYQEDMEHETLNE